jgi:pyridoxal phosphate-dependent aminotransferase EpsN
MLDETMPARIYLSPPHMNGCERTLLNEAFQSNWITSNGPQVDAFEREFAELVGVPHAAALSSGTAAIHLALQLAGVQSGDVVLCSTFTFVASASPIVWLGAEPVFIDSERESWNLDPALVAEAIRAAARRGRPPRAVVAVDIYGQTAQLGPIAQECDRHGVVLVEDAAQALGASYEGRPAGSLGRLGVYSFNGNKIVTTSCGGMLVSAEAELIGRARFLAQQAREPAAHYEHAMLGNNYRMSNLLAAVGRGQLHLLHERVERKRQIFARYREALGSLPGIAFMPEAPWGRSMRWLSVILVDPVEFGATREDVRLSLEALDIETRPVVKPMHLQPVFRGRRVVGGSVAADLFERGLCLPSGTQMTDADLNRVVDGIVKTVRRRRAVS